MELSCITVIFHWISVVSTPKTAQIHTALLAGIMSRRSRRLQSTAHKQFFSAHVCYRAQNLILCNAAQTVQHCADLQCVPGTAGKKREVQTNFLETEELVHVHFKQK
jgi:hypothetical protein